MDTYFIPRKIGLCGEILLKSIYTSVVIVCLATFIVGIVQTDTVYVLVSVILGLTITIGGCIFSRCYDRYKHTDQNDISSLLSKNNRTIFDSVDGNNYNLP